MLCFPLIPLADLATGVMPFGVLGQTLNAIGEGAGKLRSQVFQFDQGLVDIDRQACMLGIGEQFAQPSAFVLDVLYALLQGLKFHGNSCTEMAVSRLTDSLWN
jgi:hypothetical protein